MIHFKWVSLGIIVSFCAVVLSHGNDVTQEDSWSFQSREHHMSMYTIVVSKGCIYLAGFIQSVYVRQHHDSRDSDCDWENWVRTKCAAFHMPTEICAGLISCGIGCAMSTLKAPSDMMIRCNVSEPRGAAVLLGKRSHLDYATLQMCSSSRSHGMISFGRRDVTDSTTQPTGDQKSSSHQKTSNRGYHSGHGSVSNAGLRRWCTIFSRYIRRRFHFDEVKFVHSSPYWLVDVYKIGPKFGVPLMHTHGLVGCGMEYALSALNAPSWMAAFYSLSNK